MGPRLPLALGFIALIIASGCGGSSSTTPTPPPPPPPVVVTGAKYLYVANSGDNTISAFSLSATGALTPVQGSPLAAGVSPVTSLSSGSAGVLYAGTSESRNIERWLIDWNTGKLSNGIPLPTSLLNAPAWTNSGYLVPCLSHIYVFGEAWGTRPGEAPEKLGWGFTTYKLNSNGTIDASGWLGFGTSQSDPIIPNAAVDPTCQYIFHADTAGNNVVGQKWDSTINHMQGYLPAPAGTAPVAVAADNQFKFLYVVNSASNDISAFVIDTTAGTLTPLPGSPIPVGGHPRSILVAQSSFVYVSNSDDNTVSAFAMDAATGALTPVPGSPFAVGSNPGYIASAPTDLQHSPVGLLLYVANETSNNISAFVVAADGSLQPVAGSPFSVGSAPKAMAAAIGPQ